MRGRATAGVVPGFFVSAALLGLVCWLLPGSWEKTPVPAFIASFPIWMGVISASFAFTSGKRARIWLNACAVIGLGTVWGLQVLQWVRPRETEIIHPAHLHYLAHLGWFDCGLRLVRRVLCRRDHCVPSRSAFVANAACCRCAR
jgi:hypothetical protein